MIHGPAPAQTESLPGQAVRSYQCGETLDVGDAGDKRWMLALRTLVERGEFDAAMYAAGELRRAFPGATYAARIASILHRLPPPAPDERFARFIDDRERDVQIVSRSGATCVLLAFSGMRGVFGLELGLIHRWFGLLGVHVVYLRDRHQQVYNDGITELGGDYGATVDALAAIVRRLNARNVVCYGNSMGGYAALRYGLDLGASGVLAFGAPTEVSDGEMTPMKATGLRAAPALRPLYEAAARTPAVRLVYGAGHARDAADAAKLGGVPGVTLDAISDYAAHNSWLPCIERGEFTSLLRWLVHTAPSDAESSEDRRQDTHD